MIGFAPAERHVTVPDGASATLDFALATRSVQLDQIIVTGTPGGTQRRAIGNVVGTINAEDDLAVASSQGPGQRGGAGVSRLNDLNADLL